MPFGANGLIKCLARVVPINGAHSERFCLLCSINVIQQVLGIKKIENDVGVTGAVSKLI